MKKLITIIVVFMLIAVSGIFGQAATPLTNGVWANGSITASANFAVFTFNVTSGTTYRVWLNDRNATSGNADVIIEARYSDGTVIFSGVDTAWNTPRSFTANKTGTVGIRVTQNRGSTGSFSIAYSTGNTRPSVEAAVPAQPPVNLTVNSSADWIEAVNGIRNEGNNKNYIITVNGVHSVLPADGVTFGSVTNITVTLQGKGTMSLSANGALLIIGKGQTVIMKDLTMQGRENNNNPLVRIEGGTFHMDGNALVTKNSCNDTGGGVYLNNGTFIMSGKASISGNKASYHGGGVYVYYGDFTMRDSASISENSTVYGNGGGGVFIVSGTFIMSGNTSISKNNTRGYGGGVYAGSGNFTMNDTAEISGNTAGENGGGIYISGNFVMNDNTKITGNTAKGGGGVNNSGNFTMNGNASISNNKTGSDGGGIAGSVIMNDNTSVSGNISNEIGGGGISGGVTMSGNASISGNTALGTYGRGGGVNGHVTISDNASISGNTANEGGGMYGELDMKGGIISGNTARKNGGGVFVVSHFAKTGGNIYGNNETDAKLKNNAGQGIAVYDERNKRWRNATANQSMNTNTYGFWMND